jgi:hypothetical protein
MPLQSETAEIIVMVILDIHNFLGRNTTSRNMYTPPGTLNREEDGRIIEGSWRKELNAWSLLPIRNVARRGSFTAKQIRDELADYFINYRNVSWQDQYC